MKPIKLTIDGVNSYAKKQEIDFQELTSRGLFAIFGKTGSGKSTILDAMTLALYGNIPRGSKEFINSNCDKANVEYCFEIAEGQEKIRYIISRRFKKKDSQGKITSVSDNVRLSKIKDDGSEDILADKVGEVNRAIKDIIGLEEGDFLKSVVLPQGKFSEFLVLAGKDRRNMLERLFNLEEYGSQMNKKISNRKKKIEEEKNILEARLSEHTGVSVEIKKNLQDQLKEIKSLEKELESSSKIAKDELDRSLEIYKLVNNKKNLESKLEDLKGKQAEIDIMSKELEVYEYADNLMLELISHKKITLEEDNLEKELLSKKDTQKNIESDLENMSFRLESIELDLENSSVDIIYRNELISMEGLAKQKSDLIVEIKKDQANIEKMDSLLKNIDEKICELSKKAEEIKIGIENTKNDLEDINSIESISDEDFEKINSKFISLNSGKKSIIELVDLINITDSKISELMLLNEKLDNKKQQLSSDITFTIEKKKALEEASKKMDIDILSNKIKSALIENERTSGICPVCDSEYSNIVIDENVLAENELSKSLEDLNKKLEGLRDDYNKLENEIIFNKKSIEDKITEKDRLVKRLEESLNIFDLEISHIDESVLATLESTIDEIIDLIKGKLERENKARKDKEDKLQNTEKLLNEQEKEIIELENTIKIEENNRLNTDNNIKDRKALLVQKESKKASIENTIDMFMVSNKLDDLDVEIKKIRELDKNFKELTEEKNKMSKAYRELLNKKEKIFAELNSINMQARENVVNKLNLEKSIDKLKTKIESIYSSFNFGKIYTLLANFNENQPSPSYLSKEEYELYSSSIKEHERNKIEFEATLKSIFDRLDSMNLKDEEKEIDSSYLEEKENVYKGLINSLDEKKAEKSTCVYKLEEISKKLDLVEQIGKDLSKKSKDFDNVSALEKIMRGNRFVEYLSQIYLKNIVFDASSRLEKISNGRFSLEINSEYVFMVRDNFNGGNRRSADTLSGGETFLTSLALALALSTQIQLKGSAPLEFFFLDEGFGTLDSELLDTVMSSLEKLYNESMSVGIISHVEELKNRIPIKLLVEMDESKSSSIVKIELS